MPATGNTIAPGVYRQAIAKRQRPAVSAWSQVPGLSFPGGAPQYGAIPAPRYTGPPPPSAAEIGGLYDQITGLNAGYNSARNQWAQQKGQLGAARKLYLNQLLQQLTGARTNQA